MIAVETESKSDASLRREVGVVGATMMGLGSILGTGVFVSIAVAAEAAGPAVLLAIAVAAGVALCNGLSSAQLAAAHPVSGGTYEYGYRWLHPSLGFVAGWTFLCAKIASASTAALGFAGYLLYAFGIEEGFWHIALAWVAVGVLAVAALSGIRRSSFWNASIVSLALASLAFFVVAGVPVAVATGLKPWFPFFGAASPEDSPTIGFFRACALSFVAYTGYGRIATLAEEVRDPRRTIPWAIVGAMLVAMILYLAVAYVGVASVGADAFGRAGTTDVAPLASVASRFGLPYGGEFVTAGAIAAMLGVLLNLILGLSRVVLAMGRRRDVPTFLARIDAKHATPAAATVAVSLLIAGLAAVGDVRTTWSFSAFTVLIYYAITNLAALRLSDAERRFPRFIAWAGLGSCLFLAFWVEPAVWMAGLGLIAAGIIWYAIARRL